MSCRKVVGKVCMRERERCVVVDGRKVGDYATHT
jgi:hypothetical protein